MALLKDKNIYVVMTGARKCSLVPMLISELVDEGAKTFTFMTDMSRKFISQSDLAIPGNVMAADYSGDGQTLPMEDVLVVAPCTFNTLNKIANGIADNYPLSIVASAIGKRRRIIIAPAMNKSLWEHPIINRSIERLQEWGCRISWPEITPDRVTMGPIEKIADAIYYNTVKIKFPNTPLGISRGYTRVIDDNFLELKALGEYLSSRHLTKDTAGCISKRLEDGRILISSSGCQVGELRREDLTLIKKIDGCNVHWEGQNMPSSETPLMFELYAHQPSAKFAVHSHCPAITYSPKLEDCRSKEYVRYGAFGEYHKIKDILERNDGFAILNLHGEVCTGRSIREVQDKLEHKLGKTNGNT